METKATRLLRHRVLGPQHPHTGRLKPRGIPRLYQPFEIPTALFWMPRKSLIIDAHPLLIHQLFTVLIYGSNIVENLYVLAGNALPRLLGTALQFLTS